SQKQSVRGKEFSSETVKQIYALAKSFYVRCYEKRITSLHPDLIFLKNLLRRYKMGERKLPKYIDQDMMQKLLHGAPEEWKALLHFMYDTGARISEVLNVKKQHLDLKRKLVRIFEPKTMNVRITGLSQTTVNLLNEYLDKHRLNPRSTDREFVFISRHYRKISPRTVQYLVKNLSSRILGEKNAITPHYFRAACAVHLLEGGVDIRQVQEIIGWKSLSVVQNYTRVTPQRQVELKEQYHPGFKSREEILSKPEEEKNSISNQLKLFRQQMKEEQQKSQLEIKELKTNLQKIQEAQIQEKKKYEQRIDALIQLLTQKSSD
ncbi:MAG: tyrosine-type recombinase/integrase, partial [Candidatus Hodarchaeota archaeon]